VRTQGFFSDAQTGGQASACLIAAFGISCTPKVNPSFAVTAGSCAQMLLASASLGTFKMAMPYVPAGSAKHHCGAAAHLIAPVAKMAFHCSTFCGCDI
jgi:hypothetical protein